MGDQKVTSVYAIGGSLHGKWLAHPDEKAMRVVSTVPGGQDQTYYRMRFKGNGWRVSVPFWVHSALVKGGGQTVVPAHLLPPYMRQPQEVCPLLPRVRK